MDAQKIYQKVQEHYSSVSKNKGTEYGRSIAQSFGYSEEDLSGIPGDANLGLSCGNPLAIASLREGETVIDLGSGAGFDVFIAANKVGRSGRAIGVDMNKEMLARANENRLKSGVENVDFIESRISQIALQSGSTDCIISNCVINLVPEEEKQLVFNEMFRLLKPGGRIAVSDILAKQPLPEDIKIDISMYVGCIAGASQVEDYQRYLREAGFKDALIIDTQKDLNIYLETNEDGTKKSAEQKQNDQCGCCEPKIETVKTQSNNLCCNSEASPCCNVNKGATSEGDGACCDKGAAGEGDGACCWDGKDEQNPRRSVSLGNIDLNEWAASYKIFAVKP